MGTLCVEIRSFTVWDLYKKVKCPGIISTARLMQLHLGCILRLTDEIQSFSQVKLHFKRVPHKLKKSQNSKTAFQVRLYSYQR